VELLAHQQKSEFVDRIRRKSFRQTVELVCCQQTSERDDNRHRETSGETVGLVRNQKSEFDCGILRKARGETVGLYGISMNPSLTMKYVENHPEKPWKWKAISGNPNLTTEWIETHPDKPWDWTAISENLFSLHPSMRPKLFEVSQKQRALLRELHEKFDMPPMVDERAVFRKSGFGYWEGWNIVKELGNERWN